MSLLMIVAAAAAASGDAPRPLPLEQALAGRWQTQTRHGIVEIGACEGSARGPLCARLVSSDNLRKNPALRDLNNRDAALRSRPLMNLVILQGFHRADGGFAGGTIYNAEDGGTYQATLTPVDANTIKVKGCIIWPLCKSQTWTRIK